jgi:2-polyprenyl-6-methoxyphenol hydroxylase-like FAD-dependent oxidoreductase
MTPPYTLVHPNSGEKQVYYDFSKDFPTDTSFIIDPDNLYMVARITNDGLYRVTYKDIPNLSREEYISRQPKRYEEILPSHPKPHEYKITNISPYKLQQRCAPSFRVGRVLLAADAAHLCNPLYAFSDLNAPSK